MARTTLCASEAHPKKVAKAMLSSSKLLSSSTMIKHLVALSKTSGEGFYKFELKVLMRLWWELRGGILPGRGTQSEHTSAFKTVLCASERVVMKRTRVADFFFTWFVVASAVLQDQRRRPQGRFAKRRWWGKPNVNGKRQASECR